MDTAMDWLFAHSADASANDEIERAIAMSLESEEAGSAQAAGVSAAGTEVVGLASGSVASAASKPALRPAGQ